MDYTQEQLDAMLYALHESIDELELNLNIVDECEQRDAYIEQLKELDNIVVLLTNLKTKLSL